MHINDRIDRWKIIITELVVPENEGDPYVHFNTLEFKTVAELKDYFTSNKAYSVARSLGYMVKTPLDPATYNTRLVGRLSFTFADRISERKTLEFVTVQDFVRFLESHPLAAKAVEYVKR